ncbi:MAG: peptidase M28, partial [Pseudomonadota bacterium]
MTAALLAACAPAGPDTQTGAGADGEAALAAGLSEDRLKANVQTLSSDEFEGRAPITAGEEKTIAFLAEKFAAAGLQPGNDGDWYQKVPLVEVSVDEDSADLTFARAGEALMTAAYGEDQIVWTKRIRPEVSVEDAELVFVGYGIVAPERGWNDYAGLDMKGKVAVILVNDPDWQTEGLEGPFNGRAMTYYGR